MDNRGRLWSPTGKGLYRFDGSELTVFKEVTGGMGAYKDSRGRVWVASDGLYRIDPETDHIRHYSEDDDDPHSLGSDDVWEVFENDEGELLICQSSGIQVYDYRSDTFRTVFDKYAYSLVQDQTGNYWFVAMIGTNKFALTQTNSDFGNATYYEKEVESPGSLRNTNITTQLVADDGTLWIATYGGLQRFVPETDSFEYFGRDDGFPTDTISSILEDGKGFLWMPWIGGIFSFDPESGDVRKYGFQQGIEFGGVSLESSAYEAQDGTMYFGGVGGLVSFHPDKVRHSAYRPPLHITELRSYDPVAGTVSSRPYPHTVDVSWREKDLTFRFAGIDFSNPNGINYTFMLEGWDEKWREIEFGREIRYTNLPGGRYTFNVRATNGSGVWFDDPVEKFVFIRVGIHPAKTWWAISLYIFLGLSTISVLFLRYRSVQTGKLKDQEALTKKLQKVDKMKDEFLANTTHELRTPLNGIIGIAESLIEESSESASEGTKKELSLIASSGRRLTYLINDILDFSRLKEGDIEIQKDPVDLSRLVNTVLVLSKPLCSGKSLELINEVPADLPPVKGDVNRIQQILHNLVGNAINFTKEGSIKVTTQKPEGKSESTEMVEISVKDTGMGIPEDKQEEIWFSFRQVDASSTREAGGTGLGLAITKKLVEIHGGSIHLESEEVKGSTFIFTMPLAAEDTTAKSLRTVASVTELPGVLPVDFGTTAEIAAPSGSILSSGNLPRILFVDDEAINRHVVERQLKDSLYTLSLAFDGEEALKHISKGQCPNLILLDIMMPGMDGFEVCRKIRQKYSAKDLPIIMVTAKNQVADLVEGLSAGANDFISKPYSREELLARINKHLDIAKTHTAFGRFVPKDLLRLLGKGSPENLESGDHIEKQMTLLLTDFTGDPLIKKTETLAFLSSFLPQVLPVIREHHGIIHRYEGEGVMSFFPGSSAEALESSIKIQKLAAGYNTEHRLRGKRAVRIETVLHKGKLLIGTTGDEVFSGEVVLSDAVNQTLYLRDLARRLACPIMATEPVISMTNGHYNKRMLAYLSNGFKDVLNAYEIFSPDAKDGDLKMKTRNDFEEALKLFHELHFDEASVHFGKVLETNPRDNAAVLYRERCGYYMTNPPVDEKVSI